MIKKIHYHLPGLFEHNDLYQKFLSLFIKHPEYFYDWCDIGSIYGSPEDCLWSGGRTSYGNGSANKTIEMLNKYHISGRLTFSNSELKKEHLTDKKCNKLCELFNETTNVQSGIIVHSDLLLNYLKDRFNNLYYVSSTTKVLTKFSDLKAELDKVDFKYVVPDFRLNKDFSNLDSLDNNEKAKVEFLVNECCYVGCKDRKECYKNVSLKNLSENVDDFICKAPDLKDGYHFSKAMKNPSFISVEDILNIYRPKGFTNFKIEGRGLGSALILEFLLYYMVKPACQINVREEIYLDNMLDLF